MIMLVTKLRRSRLKCEHFVATLVIELILAYPNQIFGYCPAKAAVRQAASLATCHGGYWPLAP